MFVLLAYMVIDIPPTVCAPSPNYNEHTSRFVYYSTLELKTLNIIPYYWINCIHCIIVILIEKVCVFGLDDTEHIHQ